MIHPSALKKALKEKKKEFSSFFPFRFLLAFSSSVQKIPCPMSPFPHRLPLYPYSPRKKKKQVLCRPVGILLKGCFIPIPLCRIPFLRLKMIPLSLLGKGKRLKAQCCALAESSRSTDAAKHSS